MCVCVCILVCACTDRKRAYLSGNWVPQNPCWLLLLLLFTGLCSVAQGSQEFLAQAILLLQFQSACCFLLFITFQFVFFVCVCMCVHACVHVCVCAHVYTCTCRYRWRKVRSTPLSCISCTRDIYLKVRTKSISEPLVVCWAVMGMLQATALENRNTKIFF